MNTAKIIFLVCFLLQGVCCRDFSISLPQKIQALIGSCVIINCSFEIKEEYDKDLTDTAVGLWFKNGNQVFSSSTSSQNAFKGEITGTLKNKNCTTIFFDISSTHSGQYYFRIEGEGRLKWAYSKPFQILSIVVIESPVSPRLQLYEEQKEVQDQQVLEGRSVSLRCSAETLCSFPPPTLTWSSTPRILGESRRGQELISDLNFTAAQSHHRVTFICTITYQLQEHNKTAHSSITLHVQYSPKNTSVSVFPSGSVLEGSLVKLKCHSDANPAVLNYSWSRESEGQLQTGDTLTFNRTDPTYRGWFHCTALNKHGSQKSSVLLDIQYAPKISGSSSCNGTEVIVCFCDVDGNPSPKVEWHLSGRPVSNSSNMWISEKRLDSTGLRSFITLHQSRTHTSTLECVANNTHGSAKLFYLVYQQINSCISSGLDIYSLLVGLVVGTSFMAILWLTTGLCMWFYKKQKNDETALIGTEGADSGDKGEEPIYANNVTMSSDEAPTLNNPELLHYSTINFINTKPESKDIRGVSSLTTEYAVLHYRVRDVAGSGEKIRELSSMPTDAIYQVSHKAKI